MRTACFVVCSDVVPQAFRADCQLFVFQRAPANDAYCAIVVQMCASHGANVGSGRVPAQTWEVGRRCGMVCAKPPVRLT
jgi:hypothetical protein